MTISHLKLLFERAENWPETAQAELLAVAVEIEHNISENSYDASDEELRIIDDAIASIDAGQGISEINMEATFAKFRQ